MINELLKLNPLVLGILAGLFTFLVNSLGSSLVFLIKKINDKTLTLMLGISSGVMIAASFWSLLDPAITLNQQISTHPWLVPSLGFILGGALIIISDIIFSKLIKNTSTQRNFLLSTAVSLHNLPEGLAIGVAFGLLNYFSNTDALINAILLALGIGIQNFPEGCCISLPIRASGMKRPKAFLIGSFSGALELLGVIIGMFFSSYTNQILPFALSFAAGSMIAVSASELIPDAFSKNKTIAGLGLIIGFTIMMILDISF